MSGVETAALVQIGITVAAQVAVGLASTLLAPDREGPRLDDQRVTTASYGTPLGFGFGTTWFPGSVISREDFEEVVRSEGGKGGPSLRTFRYFWTGAIAICEGPIEDVIAIEADGELIYDQTTEIGEDTRWAGLEFTVYRGTPDQAPDPRLVAQEGDIQPAYRGVAYVVFDRLALEPFGNRIPQFRFIVSTRVDEAPQIATTLEGYAGQGGNPKAPATVYDRDRNVVYSILAGAEQDFVQAHSARTGQLLASAPATELGISTELEGAPQGARRINDLGGASGPYLFAYYNGGSSVLVAIRKDTLTASSALGRRSSSPTTVAPIDANTEPVISRGRQLTSATIVTGTGSTRTFILGGGGSGFLFSGGQSIWLARIAVGRLEYVWGAGQPFGGPLVGAAVGETSPAGVEFFIAARQGSGISARGAVNLYRIFVAADAFFDIASQTHFGVTDPTLVYTWTAATQDGGMRLSYDPTDRALFYVESGAAGKLLVSDGLSPSAEVAWEVTGIVNANLTEPPVDQTSMIVGGSTWAVMDGNRIRALDAATGEEVGSTPFQTGNTTVGVGYNRQSFIWDAPLDRVIFTQSGAVLYGERNAAAGVPLRDVVTAICTRGYLTPDDIDVTGLDAEIVVDGYRIERETTLRGMLEGLGGAYNFDGAEVGTKLVFRHRTGVPDFEIDRDHLIAGEGGSLLDWTRGQEIEAPAATTIKYVAPELQWRTGAAQFRRARGPEGPLRSNTELSIDVPLSLTPTEGAQFAERLTVAADIERERLGAPLRVAQRYAWASPLDVVGVLGRTVRLSSVSLGANLTLELDGVQDAAALYTPGAIGVSAAGAVTESPFLRKAALVTVLPLDIPYLRDSDDVGAGAGLIYAVAIRGIDQSGQPFKPAAVFVSDGAGALVARTTIDEEAAWGVVTLPPPDPPSEEWAGVQDAFLEARIYNGAADIASISADEMRRTERNRALLVADDGSAELIAFRTVTDLGGGKLRLSTFYRGLRGTDPFSYGQTAGRFIVFPGDGSAFSAMTEPLSRRGTGVRIAGSSGGAPSEAQAFPVGLSLRSLMPLRPWAVRREDAGGNITVTFERRPRIGRLSPPVAPPPLGETLEAYVLEVLDGPGGAVALTLEGATRSFTFAASAIGGAPAVLHVRPYQVSGQVGRGLTLERSLIA